MTVDHLEALEYCKEVSSAKEWFSFLNDFYIEEYIKGTGCYCAVSMFPPCGHCENSSDSFNEWFDELIENYSDKISDELICELSLKGFI